MIFTSSMDPVVLRSTTKSTDAPALQAGFDALTIFDSHPKCRGLHVSGPALTAHHVVDRPWNDESMAL